MSGWRKKQGVALRYDSTAEIYDGRYAEEQEAKYAAALGGLEVPLFGLVLDVGCGTGLLFDHVVDRAETVVGLDISKKTLIIAGRRSKAFPEVNLIRADADWLPLAEGIFDYVFAVTLIQNVPDPLETLREIDRVSRDDAVVVVTGLKKVFSRGEFLKLLRKSEFKVLSLKEGEDLKCFVANCSKLYHKNR